MKQLLVLLMLLCATTVFAQDVIVKKDGSTVVCRVVELTSSEIAYKKWSDLNGPNYVMNRSDATAINYESGKKISLSEAGENLYAPGNQNDGFRMTNDNALLNIDYAASNPLKKAKLLKTIGWIGGGALLVGGGLITGTGIGGGAYNEWLIIPGIATAAVGLIGGTICLISAHNIKKKARRIQGLALYEKEFKFKNGTALNPSINLLRDQARNTQSIGIGLRYNF